MAKLDLSSKSCGKMWHRKPILTENGLLVSIHNTVPTNLSFHPQIIRLTQADFDCAGEKFVASDLHGNIFVFDLKSNRYSLTQRIGSACTSLCFRLHRSTELLVALSDYSIKCFDTDSHDLVAWMKGHSSAIHQISADKTGHFAITISCDVAFLWDLDTFERKRALHRKENIDILSVLFIPMSDTIVTCFKDDSIFAWESTLLSFTYQLPTPTSSSPQYRTFTTSSDGRYFAAGGKSRYVHIWALDSKKIHRMVELPSSVVSVIQVLFAPCSFGNTDNILLVLGQDGIMRFVDLSSYKILFNIGDRNCFIKSAIVSTSGQYMTTILDSGYLHVYDIRSVCADFMQQPELMMKVADADAMKTSKKSSKTETTYKSNKMATSQQLNEHTSLDLVKLKSILRGYGEYPEKYRLFIWRHILQLPENYAAYGALVDKGVHPAYNKLHRIYPIKSRRLLRVLQRVLSALAHWAPIFAETDYLPALVFPFVKLYPNNHLTCFEIIATVIWNWSRHWFEYFPNPPINVLSVIENLICHHDNELLRHFVKYKVTSQIYAWPLLQTIFSEVLTREEWLILWDNVVSNHPSFILVVVTAYIISCRTPLMNCIELDDIKFFFRNKNPVSIKHVISESYRIDECTSGTIHPRNLMEDFVPLTSHQYPIFNKYPKFIVDYQIQERERIRSEEIDYLKYKQAAQELEKEVKIKEQEEAAWYRQQRLLADAEEKRRRLLEDEERQHNEQKEKLLNLQKEIRLKELDALDRTRDKFLDFQVEQKEMEFRRLDDEAKRKETQRKKEIYVAAKENEIKELELQLQKSLLEEEMFRSFVHGQKIDNEKTEFSRHGDELSNLLQDKLFSINEEKEHCLNKLQCSLNIHNELSRNNNTQTTFPIGEKGYNNLEPITNNNLYGAVVDKEAPKENSYLNDSDHSPSTLQLSLDRGQYISDDKTSHLMAEVRNLRERLAKSSRLNSASTKPITADGTEYS